MIGWHHQLNGHAFVQAPGDSEGQGSLKQKRVRHNGATEQQMQKNLTKYCTKIVSSCHSINNSSSDRIFGRYFEKYAKDNFVHCLVIRNNDVKMI